MTQLEWDKVGERKYETGVSHGVLYVPDNNGNYNTGVVWNGLVSVTDSPSGAESNKQYADNIVYANIKSAEEVGGTIEAFTYPDEFEMANGVREIAPGVKIGQQTRRPFGFSWQSLIGNDTQGTDYGYKIHVVYGADANPSEQTHSTVNDSPEAATLSWDYTTTAVSVPGFKPAAKLTFDSTEIPEAQMTALKDILYGTEGEEPRLPLPAEIISIFGAGAPVEVVAPKPTQAGNVITIPATTGVVYSIDGVDLTPGAQDPITDDVLVRVRAVPGYKLPAVFDADWLFEYTP